MPTSIRDVMSSPAITCSPDESLTRAATRMQTEGIGSIVVTQRGKVAGILTERDLLRAAAGGARPDKEPVRLWMTANPDLLDPGEDAAAAWASLATRPYRHLPVVRADQLVGVVSLRDLVDTVETTRVEVPRGLEGVVVADTGVGDVRGREGFYHYRQYSAVELAATRTFEDVWCLLVDGELPDGAGRRRFAEEVGALRALPPGLAALLPEIAPLARPLAVLRTAVSVLGAELAWPPTLDQDPAARRAAGLRLAAVTPTILAAAHRISQGLAPVEPRDDLGHAANYLWMITGRTPDPASARAVEQYQILTIDHGFNASTFTARVITSTGADLASAVVGAIGALSGPLHGGAPSRALDMLDAIGTPDRAEPWLRAAIAGGGRIMGFGHRVYKTDDPRSVFLRDVARRLDAPLVGFATEVEQLVVSLLEELKPGRDLYTNVEFYAGVVMDACGIPREMFTPTFASSRTVGWVTHVMEQAAANRLIRPAARYLGPPPPQRVPPAELPAA